MDSYFLLDPLGGGFAPEIYYRFGRRAVTESFKMGGDRVQSEKYLVGSLSCRYFRFFLNKKHTKLVAKLVSKQRYSGLRAELAVMTKEKRKEDVAPLLPVPNEAGEDGILLTANLEDIDAESIEHIVLVVSNCQSASTITYKGFSPKPDIKYLPFSLEAHAS